MKRTKTTHFLTSLPNMCGDCSLYQMLHKHKWCSGDGSWQPESLHVGLYQICIIRENSYSTFNSACWNSPCWIDPWESRSLMMSSCTILTLRLSAAKLYSTCSLWVWGMMGFRVTCEVMLGNVPTECEKDTHPSCRNLFWPSMCSPLPFVQCLCAG